VPIYRSDEEKAQVMPVVARIEEELAGFRLKVDDRQEVTPGFKFNDWELRGVPLRVEVGPKDVAKGTVALARRDIPGREGKSFVPQENLSSRVAAMLESIQSALFERALAFRKAHTYEPEDLEGLREAVQDGWAYAWWCGSAECEAEIKDETKATIRCIPFQQPEGTGECIYCSGRATEKVYFARAY
jgi:prolyl-tRNA synthetase